MEQTTEHSATVCPYSILPHKYGSAVNDATNKNDSKYHYDAYNRVQKSPHKFMLTSYTVSFSKDVLSQEAVN